jgi:hypothetical protein
MGSLARKPLIVLLGRSAGQMGKGCPAPYLVPRQARQLLPVGSSLRPHAIPVANPRSLSLSLSLSLCFSLSLLSLSPSFFSLLSLSPSLSSLSLCVCCDCVVCVQCREEDRGWDPVTLLAPPPGEYKGRLARNDPKQ